MTELALDHAEHPAHRIDHRLGPNGRLQAARATREQRIAGELAQPCKQVRDGRAWLSASLRPRG